MIRFIFKLLLGVTALFSLTALSACGGSFKNGYVHNNQNVSDGTDGSDSTEETKEVSEMFVHINGNKLTVRLADNSSAEALVQLLEKSDIVYTADDYGNFEKVGDIGHTLPQNNEQIHTQPGDVILYMGSNICLYYGENSWNFTRLGKIEGYSAETLRALLGAGTGSTQVRLSIKD